MGYEQRLSKAVNLGIIQKGVVTEVVIKHDNDCPLINGHASCRCDYHVILPTKNGNLYLLSDGMLSDTASTTKGRG